MVDHSKNFKWQNYPVFFCFYIFKITYEKLFKHVLTSNKYLQTLIPIIFCSLWLTQRKKQKLAVIFTQKKLLNTPNQASFLVDTVIKLFSQQHLEPSNTKTIKTCFIIFTEHWNGREEKRKGKNSRRRALLDLEFFGNLSIGLGQNCFIR